jgi:hypothetical protein
MLRILQKRGISTYEASSIVNGLRSKYESKKLQHIDAAEKDKATILYMSGHQRKGIDLTTEQQTNIGTKSPIYGLGYTSPNDM